MLSPADMVIIGAAALIIFGPDQLPKVARKAGLMMREVQNTSQSFIREMERAADVSEHEPWQPAPAPESTMAEAPTGFAYPHVEDVPLERDPLRPEEVAEANTLPTGSAPAAERHNS